MANISKIRKAFTRPLIDNTYLKVVNKAAVFKLIAPSVDIQG